MTTLGSLKQGDVYAMQPNEIVYCNIIAKGKSIYNAKLVTLTADEKGEYHNLKSDVIEHSIILKKMNCKEKEVKITELEIIHRCGFKNVNKEFTEVKGSDEKRNKITGAYE